MHTKSSIFPLLTSKTYAFCKPATSGETQLIPESLSHRQGVPAQARGSTTEANVEKAWVLSRIGHFLEVRGVRVDIRGINGNRKHNFKKIF